MKLPTEQDMLDYGESFAKTIKLPTVIELIGDVGTGKTTFTRGLAKGLGIKEPITSPSFTISKRYPFSFKNKSATLIHYDFYRLPDPGIMSEELSEAISESNTLIIIEWGDSLNNILPKNRQTLKITLNSDNSRTIS